MIINKRVSMFELLYFRDIADIFKRHMPETYAYTDTVITDYGPMPVRRGKGEGGLESLAARIANNFYNRYVRLVKYLLDCYSVTS